MVGRRKSRCAAFACTAEARPGQLMCREHWFGLPKPLRDAVWATYRAKPFDREAHLENVSAAIRHTRRAEAQS